MSMSEAGVGAETSSLTVATGADYFTDEEYRAVTGDIDTPLDASPDEVERAQAECVERLESWARAAWRPRTGTFTAFVDRAYIALPRIPVRSIVSSSLAGLSLTGWVVAPNGIFQWAPSGISLDLVGPPSDAMALLPIPAWVEVAFLYGYDEPPWAIKRPLIEATRALIRRQREESIPENASSFTSGGTTMRFSRTGPDYFPEPFPWHEPSSNDIRSYWGPKRPRRFISAG